MIQKDTLSVTLQDGVVGLVGMLHGDGLWKFPQHPLLKVFEPFVVITATDKLLVLQKVGVTTVRCDVQTGKCCWKPLSQLETSLRTSCELQWPVDLWTTV